VVPATGHNWDAGVVTTPATVNSTGIRTYTCTNANCGKTKTETIPKLDPTALRRGDVNIDGEIDAIDLTTLARHVAKIESITLSNALANADVDGSNKIDATDLTILARHVAKIESIS
jgi:hypothetical protein